MSQVFKENGDAVPVTIVQAGPCLVTQVKENAGQRAIQIGFKSIKASKLNKPQAGHLKNLEAVRILREFADVDGGCKDLQRGDAFNLESFKVGEKVEVSGISKGKGYQGVVKRHHFAGGPATHGHKDQLRMPGSIGAGGVQRVFKGLRMAGRMGSDQVTVKNLEIVEIDSLNNILKIKGALPGARNTLLAIFAPGKLIALKKEEKLESDPVEATAEVVEVKKEEALQE